MSRSWITVFHRDDRKRKRHGTLKFRTGMNRTKPRVSRSEKSSLPRERKRVRTATTTLSDSDGAAAEETELRETDASTERHSSSVRDEDFGDFFKESVDLKTMEQIKHEVHKMPLPTSVHNMADVLGEEKVIMFQHSQNDRYVRCHTRYGLPILYNGRDRNGRRSKTQRGVPKKPSPIAAITNMFSDLGILREDDQGDVSSVSSTIDEDSPESNLKRAFKILANRVDCLDIYVNNWDDAKRELETVLVFPDETKERPPATDAKKSSRTGFGKYYKLFKDLVGKQERSKPADLKWKQVVETRTIPRIAADDEALRTASAQTKDVKVAEKVDRLMEQRLKEREEAAKKAAEQILRPLTAEEQTIVRDCIEGEGHGEEILATCNTDSVQRDSMRKLRPGTWLNDEVIHYFLLMLSKRDEEMYPDHRSYFFKSFFITKLLDENGYQYRNVKRWSKRVPGKNIFKLRKIFFPVNVGGMHWTLAMIDIPAKKIQYYDSMCGTGQRVLDGLMQYLKDEHMDKLKQPLEQESEWKLVPCEPDTPQQENGFDCGVFTCMFADFLSQDLPLSFSQEHVTQCRERIAISIMNGSAIK